MSQSRPETLAEAAADLTHLNQVGESSGNARTDSEFFHRHDLGSLPRESREAFASWLRGLASATAATASSELVAPDKESMTVLLVMSWLARLPKDAVVKQVSSDPFTLRATWTENAR